MIHRNKKLLESTMKLMDSAEILSDYYMEVFKAATNGTSLMSRMDLPIESIGILSTFWYKPMLGCSIEFTNRMGIRVVNIKFGLYYRHRISSQVNTIIMIVSSDGQNLKYAETINHL